MRYFFQVLSKSGIRGKLSILLGVLALGYLIFPIDLIPDALIGPGQIDDLFFILGALGFALQTYKKNLSNKSNHE
ncbi:MAG: DUF1232 domain-containing protein [Akkermansia sp.]|nr:DUF1232 domain-containing protein [Akkermansia sp.]